MNQFKRNLLIITLYSSVLYAGVINIPTDIDSIQGGIDMAVDGDTVLVQPGKYFEKIDFGGKNIVVGSLTLTTGESSYISKTVIHGNQNGSVVNFINYEDTNAVLCGFTITNGAGDAACSALCSCGFWAGGITCINSSPTLIDLKITRNYGYMGGGILLDNSNAKLSNVTITENKAKEGGGIHFGINDEMCWTSKSKPIFDDEKRCNIYMNYAEKGSDLYSSNDSLPVNIFVDTFTVANPSDVYAFFKNEGNTIDILNYKLEQVNSDLYVNPSGDNNNNGLSPSEPLQTLSFALKKILTDSLNPHTIFISNGTYSENILPDIFDYVSILGESRSGVIFNADNIFSSLFEIDNSKGVFLEKLTIVGDGKTVGIHCHYSDAVIKNITLDGVGVEIFEASPTTIENIKISKTKLDNALHIYDSDVLLRKVEITNNQTIMGTVRLGEHSNIHVFNATLANNISSNEEYNGGIDVGLSNNYSFSIINSILINQPINAWNGNIIISNSLLSVDENDIQGANVFWLDGNINSDPMFVDTSNGDYRLIEGSPCIDAGIQDTIIVYNNGHDTLFIPPMDFVGTAPDMGAYEYGDPVAIEQETIIAPIKYSLGQNHPNPFNPSTSIEFSLPKSEFVELKVYNILGKKVSTLVSNNLNQGNHTYTFDGKNLASGIYYYRIEAGKFVQTRKMVYLK